MSNNIHEPVRLSEHPNSIGVKEIALSFALLIMLVIRYMLQYQMFSGDLNWALVVCWGSHIATNRLVRKNTLRNNNQFFDSMIECRKIAASVLKGERIQIRASWPRLWCLLAFLLPKGVHEKVWEPGVADLLESYANRKHFRSKWARSWINFCLAVRTAILVFECLAWMIPDRVIRLVFPRSK